MEHQEERNHAGKDGYLSIIFSRWQKFHAATMFFALLFAIFGCFTFGSFQSKFSPHCPLKSKIHIFGTEYSNGTYSINLNGTEWGNPSICRFVFYVPIAQMIVALIGFVLFCTQSGQSHLEGGFRHNPQLKLVPPSFMCCIVMGGISFGATLLLIFGGNAFNSSIEEQLQRSSDKVEFHWEKVSKAKNFQFHLRGAQVSYWLTTHAFLTHGVITLIRWITNADYVITEERELRENPNFQDIILQTMEEDEDTLTSVSLFSKLK